MPSVMRSARPGANFCTTSPSMTAAGFEKQVATNLRVSQVMGREVVVAITDGKLDFGTWEQIFYGEFDGKRRKRVLVKIIGE